MRHGARPLAILCGLAAAGDAADVSVMTSAALTGSPEATWSLVGHFCRHPHMGFWRDEVGVLSLLAVVSGLAKLRHDPKVVRIINEVVHVPMKWFPSPTCAWATSRGSGHPPSLCSWLQAAW